MSHVMVDLETLGPVPGSKVVSIGAVRFDEAGTHETFSAVIQRAGQPLEESESTLKWWDRQPEVVSHILRDPSAVPIKEALIEFTKWMRSLPGERVYLWGNGSDFDNTILSAAYRVLNLDQPWRHSESRCYRTLASLAPHINMQRVGTHHNALDDAVSQARHASAITLAMRIELEG